VGARAPRFALALEARRIARRPRPLEVVAAQLASRGRDFTDEVQARDPLRLERGLRQFVSGDTAPRDLRLAVAFAARRRLPASAAAIARVLSVRSGTSASRRSASTPWLRSQPSASYDRRFDLPFVNGPLDGRFMKVRYRTVR